MSIRDELLALQQADPDGILYPPRVLQWAADNPGSATHSALDWDDVSAAHAHRLWQIRRMIQVHVVTEERDPIVVSLTVDRKAAGGYRRIDDVIKVPNLREIMMEDALADLQRMQAKYGRLQELGRVWDAAERLRKNRSKKRVKAVPSRRKKEPPKRVPPPRTTPKPEIRA
jgi:hypothetical protein